MIDRRKVLAGLAGLGASIALPAWAQAIRSQSDPYAQVDPYADPRNGFSGGGGGRQADMPRRNDMFDYSRGGRAFSEAEEREELVSAQQNYFPAMEEDGGPIRDPRIDAAIKQFITPLAKACDRPNLPWEAHVCRSMDINAWTCGGGKLAFNAGLVAMCDHPGELAAVVAHEMGHVVYGHGIARQSMMRAAHEAARRGIDMGANRSAGGLVGGPMPGNVKTQFDLLRAGYIRANEYQADEYSVELLRRVGIDPRWSVLMLEKLGRFGYEHGHHMLSPLVMDHPLGDDRADNLRTMIGVGARERDDFVPPGWSVLKSAIPTDPKWKNG